jgi:hypothetical protein
MTGHARRGLSSRPTTETPAAGKTDTPNEREWDMRNDNWANVAYTTPTINARLSESRLTTLLLTTPAPRSERPEH